MVAAVQDISSIFTPPRSMDLAALLVGDDLNQFEKTIDQFDLEAASWRAQAMAKLANFRPLGGPPSKAEESVRGDLAGALQAVEAGIETLSQPLHSDPAVAQKVAQLTELSAGAGKFVRKLMRRIEKIRVAQHAAHVDLYYGLLALQSELDKSEPLEPFEDPSKLTAFLRGQIA
jgi:hypothetical protein